MDWINKNSNLPVFTMTEDKFMDKALNRDEETISNMFSKAASRYDFLNHFLSLNCDTGWRKTMVRKSGFRLYGDDVSLLDLCCGTGDVAFEFLRDKEFKGQVTGVDFAPPMIDLANKKAVKPGFSQKVKFIEGNVLKLPFENESFDIITIAFGLRNLSNLEIGLSEMFRMLKKGGRFMSLEFFRPESGISRSLSDWYIKYFIPFAGRIISGNDSAYQYFPLSRDKFSSAIEFDEKLRQAGFHDINHGHFLFRISTLHTAIK